jgi:predicted N-formylglutamate amidohydrolase
MIPILPLMDCRLSEKFKPYQIIQGDISKGLILLCDHARNTLPAEYGTLGLPASELERHIAYDIGAEGVMRGLAKRLGVPGVMTTYSRLLIDPNRGVDDPTLVRQLYDGTVIPGNYPLSQDELTKRIERYFRPYHQQISKLLALAETKGVIPVIFSIHTMTDKWNGEKRPWHTSVLWDSDHRIPDMLLEELRKLPGIVVGDNEPYNGALGGDTMFTHCTQKGLAHGLIEIRQDLVSNQEGINQWVDYYAPIIEKLNGIDHNHEKKWFGTRTAMALDRP